MKQYAIFFILLPLFLTSCAIATRDGDKIMLKGIGKAKWSDGTEIESKSIIELSRVTIKE